jgi:hypothetical protein
MMRSDVPPDLRTVLDAVHLYKEIKIALVLLERFEVIGISVRGNFLKTSHRYDFNPVLNPSQNGDDVVIAETCGRKYRAAFMMWIRRSLSGTPT